MDEVRQIEFPTNYLDTLSKGIAAGGPRNEWEEQLDHFIEKLNPGRIADGFQPYTHSRIARILSKAGIHDASAAYVLYNRCLSGHSFSRLFAHLTKV